MKDKIEAMRAQLKSGIAAPVYTSAIDFFPTPAPIAERMARELDLRSFDQVLEPSAGSGNLLKACTVGNLIAIEHDSTLCTSLIKNFPKVNVHCFDFLDVTNEVGKVDKILMNPPFKHGADIDHIRHAFSLLKEGGRLVAVCCEGPFFRQDKKSKAFRQFLEDNDATDFKLPEGSFKSSGTMVSTRMVIIDKGEA
jgi:predicted RNA methylase